MDRIVEGKWLYTPTQIDGSDSVIMKDVERGISVCLDRSKLPVDDRLHRLFEEVDAIS